MADFGINPKNGSHVFAGSGVWLQLDKMESLDQLEAERWEPDPNWLNWMGYEKTYQPDNLITALERAKDNRVNHTVMGAEVPAGYLTNSGLSFMQLRLNAENAIAAGKLNDAASFLKIACQMRPTHRNVARRLAA